LSRNGAQPPSSADLDRMIQLDSYRVELIEQGQAPKGPFTCAMHPEADDDWRLG
jgi:hypothetical protein